MLNRVKIFLMGAVVLVVIAAAVFCSPRFLAYSTACVKADAVVVLLGPDFSARHRHARNLVYEGMADYLIIPAYKKTYRLNDGKITLFSIAKNEKPPNNSSLLSRYYEDTHVELLEARRTMALSGQKSAIFVSSPYHMRRIKLMVSREFAGAYQSCFSPTPFEPAPVNAWELKTSDWKKVWREYTKILWFMIYCPFTK
ncbi:MAG: ElyC/SanA/YdcF family protein [Smithellaceae bacterium]|nr:YdcF family protein [Syntrophaceae bacterium]MDD4241892.1 ElyC/SanA/YdcF family protein [Smithellaceae bacterium]NLX51526.1 DUF218 domain-containing protein [Deltaproteobacteria bacterium]